MEILTSLSALLAGPFTNPSKEAKELYRLVLNKFAGGPVHSGYARVSLYRILESYEHDEIVSELWLAFKDSSNTDQFVTGICRFLWNESYHHKTSDRFEELTEDVADTRSLPDELEEGYLDALKNPLPSQTNLQSYLLLLRKFHNLNIHELVKLTGFGYENLRKRVMKKLND